MAMRIAARDREPYTVAVPDTGLLHLTGILEISLPEY